MKPGSTGFLWLLLVTACGNPPQAEDNSAKGPANDKIDCPDTGSLDPQKIETITGIKATSQNGEFKITVPQNDLNVMVDGFKIIPPMGLGSWAAFSSCGDEVLVMGDIIVTHEDLKPVQAEVINQGIMISAIHNHFVRSEPPVMFMHIGGRGTTDRMITAINSIFRKIVEVRGMDPKTAPKDSVLNTLDIHRLDSIMGITGSMNSGVYKYVIGRPDVELLSNGFSVSTFMGFNTWASWQGTPEKAAVAGDFAMLENEVEAVVSSLIKSNIEVVALHNHMVHENPRIFFLHYWGVGPADELARGLRQALDVTPGSNPN